MIKLLFLSALSLLAVLNAENSDSQEVANSDLTDQEKALIQQFIESKTSKKPIVPGEESQEPEEEEPEQSGTEEESAESEQGQ